jgi:hypothetical protein
VKSFCLSYEVHVTLTVDQIWPNGDAPSNPTALDVEAVIEQDGGWCAILSRWNLDEEAETSVREVQPFAARRPRPGGK